MAKRTPKAKGNGTDHLDGEETWHSLNRIIGGILTDRGHLAERAGDDASALQDFERAVQVEPDDALSWYNYGDTLLKMGRVNEALIALERAVKLSPDNALYRYDLGLALYDLQRYKEAAEHFKFVLRLDPALERAISQLGLSASTNLALCYGEQGDWPKAIATLKPAQSVAVNILYNLGRFYGKNNSHTEAARFFTAAAILSPDDENILHGAGYALLELKRYQEAENYFAQATKVDPSCIEGWYDRGVNLAKMKKKSQARACFVKILKRDPKHAYAFYQLACLDALERKRDSAFRNLALAVDRGLRALDRVRRDRDLNSLRSDPRWKALMTRMKKTA
jgi:tetratricopeptide (TPR) repeat protein